MTSKVCEYQTPCQTGLEKWAWHIRALPEICYDYLLPPSDSQENPELIWNDEAREKVSAVVAKMTKE